MPSSVKRSRSRCQWWPPRTSGNWLLSYCKNQVLRNKSVSGSQLSPEQQAMEKLWEEHVASEFKSAEAAINTVVEQPLVNHVRVMTGGSWSQAANTLLQ